jgi:hypothetical protein
VSHHQCPYFSPSCALPIVADASQGRIAALIEAIGTFDRDFILRGV